MLWVLGSAYWLDAVGDMTELPGGQTTERLASLPAEVSGLVLQDLPVAVQTLGALSCLHCLGVEIQCRSDARLPRWLE